MRIMMRSNAAIVLAVFAMALSACTDENREIEIGTAQEGEVCKQYSDCFCGADSAGVSTCLTCEDDGNGSKACVAIEVPTGPQRGDPCTVNDQCGDLFCGQQGVCTPNEGGSAGESCGLTVDCQPGLVCNGYCGVCTEEDGDDNSCPRFVIPTTNIESFEGVADLGEACLTPLSCRRPYICGPEKTCMKLPAISMATCSQSAEELGAFRAYWELPPENIFDEGAEFAPDFEFYRLPFPNDMRRVGSTISLAGHFVPEEILGTNVQSSYVDAAEKDAGGFAPNAPIFFRFSDYVMESSICLSEGSAYPDVVEEFPETMFDAYISGEEAGEPAPPEFCTNGAEQPSVALVDLSTGEQVPVQLAMTRSAGAYICHNSVAIGALDGQPLKHNTTYAAYVTTALEDIRGGNPIWDWDFARLMCDANSGDDDFTDDDCGDKWEPYSNSALQPFLDWLDNDSGLKRTQIAAATVFTTNSPASVAMPLREAVYREAVPTFGDNAVLCDTDVVSPCDDGLLLSRRGCTPANGAYDVIQGHYSSPIYQAGFNEGGRPYRTAESGGQFVYGTDGVPVRQGTEDDMCYSLAVPKGDAPENGWPVVIYAHGTGGSYASQLYDGTAARFTEMGYAVISFDNVMHGPRSGMAPEEYVFDAGMAFFNLANPRASRDNVLQGSADLFQLVRLVRNAGVSAGGVDVSFDPSLVAFFGHSQGTVIAPAFLAAESDISAALLSGAGSELALSILNKKEPVDIAALTAQVFGDKSLARLHPMMGIFSALFGPADAISYADMFANERVGGDDGFHIMMTSGLTDSYTPKQTHAAMIRSQGFPLVGEVSESIPGVEELDNGVSGNSVHGKTVGVVQVADNPGSDGHFVIFSPATGGTEVGYEAANGFMESLLTGTPVISK